MDEVSKVREKVNVVEIISEVVTLKKAGSNFKGLCPFHSEKTSSFVVSPERQIWHCFGCGKGGDAFQFLMEYENMDFPEALRILARKAGIELVNKNYDTGVSSKKEKIYKLNKLAGEYYNYVLENHSAGREALAYLIEQRKMNPGIIKTFEIGFSPKGGVDLLSFLIKKKNFKLEDLQEAGLITFSRGKNLDFFRGRIMFPLTDNRGNVVGFSARVITEIKDSPKYINTRETLVYHKGSLFFGLDKAIGEIKNKDKAIIVEGEFDVISCFMNGIKNVVAIKGTALTEDQVGLLSRYTKNIALCLDQDTAGFEAIKRSLSILEKKEMTVTVVVMSGAKDADEAIKKDVLGFKKEVAHDVPVYDFLLSSFSSMYDSRDILGKKKIADAMLPFIVDISNEIVKEHVIKKLSQVLDTTYESLVKQMDKIQNTSKKEALVNKEQKVKKGRKETLEEYLMAVIVQSPDISGLLNKAAEILGEYKFEIPSYEKVFAKMVESVSRHNNFNAKDFGKTLSSELLSTYNKWFLFPIPDFKSGDKMIEEVLSICRELKTIYSKKRMQELTDKIKNAKTQAEEEALQKEINRIINFLS